AVVLLAGSAVPQTVSNGSRASSAPPGPPRNLTIVVSGSVPKNVPSRDPAGIFDGAGNFNADAYVNTANAYGTTLMVPERFGSSSAAYKQDRSVSTWSQASSIQYVKPSNPGESFYYSRGVPCTTPDEYSSNYAQVAYVTDAAMGTSKPG